jgi:iron complex outermembrane receptor protein
MIELSIKTRLRVGVVAIAAVTAALPAWAADDGVTVAAAAATAQPIDDVIVTARRREEKLQDVPVAITAIGATRLRDAGVSQLAQLMFEAPSVNIGTPNPRQTSISIRGLGNNPAADGLASSVGVYLDGVYLDRLGMANFDLADVDRVEVLRGPQGTLFGKNTTAGAISVTTKAPSFTPEVYAQADFGDYALRQIQASVSAPLSDTVAVRLSGYDDSRRGYLDNIEIGGHELSLHRHGLRGQLLFNPNDRISWRIIGEYGREADSAGALVLYSKGPSTSANPRFVSYDTWAANLGITPVFDPNGLVTDKNERQHLTESQYAATSILDVGLGDYTLTAVTGYRWWKFTPHNDFDWTSSDVIANQGVIDKDEQFSQEVRIASPTGRKADFVAGAYFFYRKLDANSATTYGSQYAQGLGAFGNPALNNGTTRTLANPTVHSYALFGQGSWHIAPTFDLTLGGRATYEREREDITRLPFVGGTGTAPVTVAPYSGRLAVSNWTPSGLATLSWKPQPGLLAYATVSYGAKAGGFNAPSVPQSTTGVFLPTDTLKVKSEKATNGEIGVKATLFDNLLTLDVNGFYTVVRDYQANTIVQTSTGFQALITNVGSVHTKGVEVEATLRPLPRLSLRSALGYNDAVYHSFRDAPSIQGATATTQDLSGRPVVQAPRWNINLNADYEVPLNDGTQAYAGADFNYKSGYYGYIDDSPYSWIHGYTVTNFRAGVRLAHGRYDVSGWIRNAFDHRYFYLIVPASTGSAGYVASVAEPRTYGVSLKLHF